MCIKKIPVSHKKLLAQSKKCKCKSQVFNHLPVKHNLCHPMFMPYIEGPKMDWTVNDGLYHRFLKWKLKCGSILDCELAMLPKSKKCKKVIEWSGDFWNGSICFLVLAHGRSLFGYNMGQLWRFLQATSTWNHHQIWPAYMLQTRKSISRWMVQSYTRKSVSCQVPTRKTKYLA